MASKVTEEYGSLVFSDSVMRERLPKPTYKELSRVIKEGKALNLAIANEVAHAMKEWALEKGATHYTHWFQPLTGITSEKHDAFMEPTGDGRALETFSGKALIQGEPDASSFPSGGLRATFEARGYTAWDPTSPAFIKDEVLCVPTAFISYTGEALDKKTPLLRSCVALDGQAKRVLKLFGKDIKSVTTTVGPEQEYFLIKEEDYAARPDLIMCGRTLFGCEPVKGQELEEHYFGAIRPTVNEFMKELDDELWKLAVPAKTKHNEVAPCQHELAPIFETSSKAIDHNLVTMEKMKIIASHHGLTCLQHEKPFDYVNGSGKHNNWSISADGKNLLDPSDTPEDNLQFLVFLSSVIAAVDDYQDLMRASVASAGNDHRLGANEAPPAIVSIFLGDDLAAVVDALINDKPYSSHPREKMDLGVPQLADLTKDSTDRNRTSPFAFTGNKFEFRMCGSQQNLSDPNMVLNTAVAEQLDRFATDMADVAECDFIVKALEWVKATLTAHQRIIFNGNGYSDEWPAEAEKRGLLNMRTAPDALPCLIDKKNLDLFEKYHVASPDEMHARYVSKAEQYAKLLNIEANTMVYMTKHMYLPALFDYSGDIATTVATKAELGIAAKAEKALVQTLTDAIDKITDLVADLEQKNAAAQSLDDPTEQDNAYRDSVIPAMDALRVSVDEMEKVCGHDYWPVPSYNRILFYV
ncbi:glutamine synthetase [Parolsenella catena]|uniref:Glutamine synthetase n=5 Tax=Parolsenella TaxID=2082587 RepID=A0A3G9K165_9ACTN|nr:glutamine synthetase III [Parolsenella catena]BBH49986.1 glutamine synthetase [Parolsenella catena]